MLAADFNGDGTPEIFFARQDGFVNVFKLADGSDLGRLNIGEPIIGMAALTGKDGKPRLAVGTSSARTCLPPRASVGMGPIPRGQASRRSAV